MPLLAFAHPCPLGEPIPEFQELTCFLTAVLELHPMGKAVPA